MMALKRRIFNFQIYDLGITIRLLGNYASTQTLQVYKTCSGYIEVTEIKFEMVFLLRLKLTHKILV